MRSDLLFFNFFSFNSYIIPFTSFVLCSFLINGVTPLHGHEILFDLLLYILKIIKLINILKKPTKLKKLKSHRMIILPHV
jgi:hypothetical protein